MALKYIPVSDLKSGAKLEAVYLMASCQTRPKKDGTSFLTMSLVDATGKISGVMWDNFDAVTSGRLKENDYVEVGGEVLTYNNQLQFRVARIAKVEDSAIDPAFFIPTCPISLEKLEEDFWALVDEITDPDYRALIDTIFKSPEFWAKFRIAPSARSMHQAYLGGLLEHTLCVTRNALKLADNYPAANRSLLIAGSLLHDMGKTLEYSFDKKIGYTDAGRLIGHITMGAALVELHASLLPGFPHAKKIFVQHMIISHHGFYEFGSPKRPKILEALLLHHADVADAQISNYMEYCAAAEKNGARWEYSNMFERYMFAGERIEGGNVMRDIAYPAQLRDRQQETAENRENDDLANSTMEETFFAPNPDSAG